MPVFPRFGGRQGVRQTILGIAPVYRLNGLHRLHASFLENARQCQEKCNEERTGNAFPEGWAALEYEIKDALDQNEQDARERASKATLKRDNGG
jgi:hypothetical protein